MSANGVKLSLSALAGLGGAPAPARPRGHYRRSTTTKAPRKRTFIMLEMEKHSPGVRSSGSGSMLCKATSVSSCELLQSCCGGDNNNVRGGGSGRPPRSGGSGSGPQFGGSGGGGDVPPAASSLPRALVVGAAAAVAALVLLPSPQAVATAPGQAAHTQRVAGASTGSLSGAPLLPGSPRAPRNMCLNHPAPPPPLPLTANTNAAAAASKRGLVNSDTHAQGKGKGGSKAGLEAIVYGHVHLTEEERRLLTRNSRQLHFTEYVRVGGGPGSSSGTTTITTGHE